jgi:hypothetical protein
LLYVIHQQLPIYMIGKLNCNCSATITNIYDWHQVDKTECVQQHIVRKKRWFGNWYSKKTMYTDHLVDKKKEKRRSIY